MEASARSMTRRLVHRMDDALEQDEKHRKIVAAANITEEDREFVRSKLLDAAEHIRKKYGLQIPLVRSFLHEMLDVSV